MELEFKINNNIVKAKRMKNTLIFTILLKMKSFDKLK